MGMDDEAGSSAWGKKAKRKVDDRVVEDEGDEDDVGADGDGQEGPTRSKKKKAKKTAGIVYISRLPPGMTPHKVRHLMARWGDVGRVYAQRRDGEC